MGADLIGYFAVGPLKIPITRGNHKLPASTAVLNVTPASLCPSRVLGLCQMDHCGPGISSAKCYARRPETNNNWRPEVLPHRMLQMEWWAKPMSGETIIEIEKWLRRQRKPVTAFRIGESGDFRSQVDVDKMCLLAATFYKQVWYCYTARRDLDFSKAPDNMVVNGSGYMYHNNYVLLAGTQADTKVDYMCPGSCKTCSMCLKRGNKVIGAKLH